MNFFHIFRAISDSAVGASCSHILARSNQSVDIWHYTVLLPYNFCIPTPLFSVSASFFVFGFGFNFRTNDRRQKIQINGASNSNSNRNNNNNSCCCRGKPQTGILQVIFFFSFNSNSRKKTRVSVFSVSFFAHLLHSFSSVFSFT